MSNNERVEAGEMSAEPHRDVRIAAIGDMHFDGTTRAELRALMAELHQEADVLVLCGDLTTHGKPEQMKAFAEELASVMIPVVAVLGNHDYESGCEEECTAILSGAGVQVLDGTNAVVHGVGFAGTKGFAGGFGRGALGPFGEKLIKDFVSAALDEARKIENALRSLTTESKVVLLHYAPIVDTVVGEPETIYAFLGSSRMLEPIDTLGANVIFHGHAHHGTLEGRTPKGIPVYNVAQPLLRDAGMRVKLFNVPAPDRRHADTTPGIPGAPATVGAAAGSVPADTAVPQP
jgi:Icc-related predicted phosphoesterase